MCKTIVGAGTGVFFSLFFKVQVSLLPTCRYYEQAGKPLTATLALRCELDSTHVVSYSDMRASRGRGEQIGLFYE